VLRNKALGYQAAGDALFKLGKRGAASHAFEESLKLLDKFVKEKNVEDVQCDAAMILSKVSRIIEEGAAQDTTALNPKDEAASYLEEMFGNLTGLKAILMNQVNRLKSESNNLSNPK
jgi:hypothetical protein